MRRIVLGDNLPVLEGLADECADLVYVDPPFNTGKRQERTRIKTVRDEAGGDRIGFQGKRYRTIKLGSSGYSDVFADYLAFLQLRLVQAHRILKANGSLFFRSPNPPLRTGPSNPCTTT